MIYRTNNTTASSLWLMIDTCPGSPSVWSDNITRPVTCLDCKCPAVSPQHSSIPDARRDALLDLKTRKYAGKAQRAWCSRVGRLLPVWPRLRPTRGTRSSKSCVRGRRTRSILTAGCPDYLDGDPLGVKLRGFRKRQCNRQQNGVVVRAVASCLKQIGVWGTLKPSKCSLQHKSLPSAV